MWTELRAAWALRPLLRAMVWREVQARHAGTAGGLLWLYAQPLLTIAAYYLVFDVVFAMRLGEGAPARAVGTYLIVGMLPWQAFAEGLSRGMHSLVDAGHLLQKNALPPVLVVLRAVLGAAVVYAPLLLLLAVAYAPLHGFAWPMLALPLVLALQMAFVFVLAYLLAILAAALRDTLQVVAFLLSVGVFVSPILFPITLFPEGWRWVLWLNPMTSWVLAYQDILLQAQWPRATAWAGMLAWLAVAWLAWRPVWRRSRDELVDWL
ncbi:ABC transporter permease [Acidovorax lacteus]|uniref:ABC-2 type transporter transmembrane domain-containing protein n=1 Tax=Acidovorax lacteus TaxID=1924988 RepID=A0ABP8KZ45_9BURK